jgi:anti-anti-sigma factor
MGRRGFEVLKEQDGARVVVAASGEVDMATVGGLRAELEQAVASGAEVWVDLTDVDFIDSTGLSALVIAHRAMSDGTRRFAVICPDGPARRALEVCGLGELLHVFDSRDAAHTG